jgi:hypothetical protein
MHDDIEAQIAAYRKHDADKVKQLRAESFYQKRMWDDVNWPRALWHNRLKQMRLYWDGQIGE